jgi:Asp-tRNA(Asn)/Glu-tRNA(Gln) amidotransferase A subunit family amidase
MRISERTLLTCSNTFAYKKHRAQSIKAFKGPGKKSNVTQHIFSDRTRSLEQRGALFGLTFCIKDNILVRGAPCSLGLAPPLLSNAHVTAPLIAWLEDCGASLSASTNLDPLALDFSGRNPYLGDVPNALHKDRICGGSSSGAAYAVAASYSDFAIGTDSGGSIRIPAVANGVCGYRPSSSLLPRGGIFLLSDTMDVPGLICRNPLDLHDMLISLGLSRSEAPPLTTLLLPHESELQALPSSMRSTFESSANRLSQQLSLTLKQIDPVFEPALAARKDLFAFQATKSLRLYFDGGIERQPLARSLFAYSDSLSAEALSAASTLADQLFASLKLLDSGSLLLTPALPSKLPLASADPDSIPPLHYYLCLANLLDLPSVAFCVQQNQPETGIQLVFGRNQDHLVAKRIMSVIRGL